MPTESKPASPPFESTLPKVIAAAIASGGRLTGVNPELDGRLRFTVENVAPDFELRLARDEVQVSAAKMIAAMESVLTLINSHQRRGGRR
jgi:hypothetical protein